MNDTIRRENIWSIEIEGVDERMYDALFQPIKIGTMEIKNRTVNEPMGTSYCNEKGECTDQEVAFYAERAKGGIGLIITECMPIVPGGPTGVRGGGNSRQLIVTTDAAIPELKKLADGVHAAGAPVVIEIYHSGNQGDPSFEDDGLTWSPSGQESALSHAPTREMTVEEIKYLIQCFVDATVRAEKAGIDGVELHAAHGYLLNEFLSPYSNHRTDEYGGSTENRCRIVKEIMEGIRAVLPEYPVIIRYSADEYLRFTPAGDVGITLEEGVAIAREFEKYGIDAIDVSAGTYETMNWAWEPVGYEQGYKIMNAAAVKAAVNIPVIACSVLRDPAYCNMVIEKGYTDMVGSARQFLADPAWPNKTKEGRTNEIHRCISCLNCMETLMGEGVTCTMNPRAGHEAALAEPAKDGAGRKVVVVGAGPAGMEAAHVLAQRGFDTVILEAKSQTGGQLNYADKAPCKYRIDWLMDLERLYAEKHGIQIKLNTPATVETIKAEEPYAVIWAAGAAPVKPGSIPGINLDCVVTPPEVLSGDIQLYGKNICVVGSGMTGIETAEFLADGKENTVNVYEMAEKIGPGMHFQTLIDVLGRLMPTGTGLFPGHQLVEVREGEADFKKVDTEEIVTVKFDVLVCSLGTRGLAVPEDIAAAFPDIIAVGDAEHAGKIAHATSTGYMAGYNLK